MEMPAFYTILSQPLSFWAANCNEKGSPDIIRCCGISYQPDKNELVLFIGEKLAAVFLANTKTNPLISLIGTSLYTLESYQYKGRFTGFRPCTEEEVEWQYRYVSQFADTLTIVGFNWEKETVVKSFFHQPSVAIGFRIDEVFEQTPRKGTGERIDQQKVI